MKVSKFQRQESKLNAFPICLNVRIQSYAMFHRQSVLFVNTNLALSNAAKVIINSQYAIVFYELCFIRMGRNGVEC